MATTPKGVAGSSGAGGTDMLDSRRRKSHFDMKAFIPERVGSEITKRYEITRHDIGNSGKGKVFLAKDRQMQNRLVAIKQVTVSDEAKKVAFKKQVDVMKSLDHPNICKLLETYEHDRLMFFVMEYCEGREVFHRIMDNGNIGEKTAADILRQTAGALKYAHNRNVVHRDLKPENICFCTTDPKDNSVKVIEWGLAYFFGQAEMSSAVGRLTYAAPEVLEAREVAGYQSACDLWSLGVVTYVMLSGKPPFWGNFAEQLKRMKRESYPMSDATWKAVSVEAKDLIKGLLKCDPKARMPLDKVLVHPWMKAPARSMDANVSRQVLSNMRNFSNTSQFFSVCVASVARQLDHKNLRDVHKVFCEMDTNGDGVLSLAEVKAGFEKIFGKGSKEIADIEAVFKRLDLDGSGHIDYTEFCAAGMGERKSTEEHVLWAAFKAFDIQDDDGKITRDEIKQVLLRADVDKFWTAQVCNELSDELFARYDKDNDGALDFDEFCKLMREISQRNRNTPSPMKDKEAQLLASAKKRGERERKSQLLFNNTYKTLVEMDRQEAIVQMSPKQDRLQKRAELLAKSSSSRGGFASRVRNRIPTCCACSSEDKGKCTIM